MNDLGIGFEKKPLWKRNKLQITLSFSEKEIRFKFAEDSKHMEHSQELIDWAVAIFNAQPEDSRTLRCQIDEYTKKASFRAGSKKSREIVLVEELPNFLVLAMRDLFEAFCKDRGLYYEFDRTVVGYENLDTYKAYTIFKYSGNWRRRK